MGYYSVGLSFDTLRKANIHRLPQFKNKHGGLAHTKEDGSDWSPSQWLQAVIGELGEYANERKKYERGDLTLGEFKEKAAKELADVQCYLDILARRCLDDPTIEYVDPNGIDLGQATVDKFNEVSKRVGSTVVIIDNGTDWDNTPCTAAQMLLAKESRAISPSKTLYASVLPSLSTLEAMQRVRPALDAFEPTIPPADTAELQNLPDAVERVRPRLTPQIQKALHTAEGSSGWTLVPKDEERRKPINSDY